MTIDRSRSLDGSDVKFMAEYGAKGVGFLCLIVAHRILGPLATIGYLGHSAYHGLRLNYHWRHSREKNAEGHLIEGTEINQLPADDEKNYMNRNARFNSSDIKRLQHEVERIYSTKVALESIKWARGHALCTLVGPFSAFVSEMGEGGSVELPSCGCGDYWHHISPEEMLDFHINALKRKQHS